jgi:hypothetical protein
MNTNNLIQEVKNKLTTQQKVELFKYLYKEIAGKGIGGDTELAHINTFESRLLRMIGGAGTINPETGLKQYFGGGGGGGAAPATQTQFVREAPGIEERKLELMDLARDLTQTPERLPAIQMAPMGALEQQGVTASGVTGVGAPTTQAGIGSVLSGLQAAQAGPNISQFYNPYQSYVLDEINRQAQMKQQGIADQAIHIWSFWWWKRRNTKSRITKRNIRRFRKSTATRIWNCITSSTKSTTACGSNWITSWSNFRSIRNYSTNNGSRRYKSINGGWWTAKTTCTTRIRCNKTNSITTTI